MGCTAIFIDGPERGQVRTWEEAKPPDRIYTKRVWYVREPDIFDPGNEWIFMTEVKLEKGPVNPHLDGP